MTDRSVMDDGYNIARKEMKEKMALPESQELYKQRAIDVEPIFGQIKYNRNFMSFSVRGLSKVKTQFTLACIAHNLSKIIRYMQENPEKLAEIYKKIADLIFTLRILLKNSSFSSKIGLPELKQSLYSQPELLQKMVLCIVVLAYLLSSFHLFWG